MLRCLSSFLLGAAIAAATFPPPVALADSEFAPRSIEAAGSAHISTDPDRARVVVAVSSQASTAKQAVEETARKMKDVVATLKNLVAQNGKVETSSYNVLPQYSYGEGPSRARKLTGYQATNTAVAETAKLDSVGGLIDAVVADGANEIQGVAFFLADETEVRRRALIAAGRAARAEAEAIAESLQVDLGPIMHATVVPVGGPMPHPMMRSAAFSEAAPSTEILAGAVEVSATVHVTFGIR